jgi:UDP-N-acetyl-2-amino-2-deoxyglucuronate dehydrogenase
LELAAADVRWFVSVDRRDLPPGCAEQGVATHRSMRADGEEFEFSTGFTDLHTAVYTDILAGHGFGIAEARPSIKLVHELRLATVEAPELDLAHPLLNRG